MSIWKKIRNYLADLYNWRMERGLVKEESQRMWEMAQRSENLREALIADYHEAQKAYESRIDELTAENARLAKHLEAMGEALREQHDLNACLLEDWGKKYAEWAEATKKLQDKDDAEYRLWAEHHILLATMLITDPEEAAKFHV